MASTRHARTSSRRRATVFARGAWLLGVAGVAVGLVGCGAAAPVVPTVSVVASLAPLAMVAAAVGGSSVKVTDLALPGVDPRSETPSTAQQAGIHAAAVVFDVGGGFQPAIESAVASAHSVVSLGPALGPATDGRWLDPTSMKRLAGVVARALSGANPARASSYANGARDFSEQMVSSGIDFESALGSCPRRDIAAPDSTLAGLAKRYHLRLHELGSSDTPSASEIATAAGVVSQSKAAVFSEPWVNDATVVAAGAQAGSKVRYLDTLEAPPARGWPPHESYPALLAGDLATLTAGLGCSSVDATTS